MAGSRKSLTLIVAVLFMGCLFFINEARPLNSAKLDTMDDTAIKNFFDGLSIEAIKNSGPSSGGHGHKASTGEMMEENMTGGLRLSIEAIKNSGPSSGGHGHKATAGEMMEENMTGGPSSGGRGHEATIDGMMEENERSALSPGQGN